MDDTSKKLVEKYLIFHSSKSKETLKRYRGSLYIFMEYFPDKSWDNITVDDAIRFYNLYSLKVSKDTVVKRLKDVSRFLDWCVEYRYVLQNNIKLYVKSLKLQNNGRDVSLTEDEVNILLSNIRDYFYYVYTLFILTTGVRISEFKNITMEDVHLKDRLVYIRGGKGNKDRVVFICDELYPFLCNYIKHRGMLNPKTNKLFVNKNGYKLSEKHICEYRDYLKEASKNLSVKVTPHILRHTFGTLSCKHGMNLQVLSKLMGHSSMAITSKYLHPDKDTMKSDLNRTMSRIFRN